MSINDDENLTYSMNNIVFLLSVSLAMHVYWEKQLKDIEIPLVLLHLRQHLCM